MAYENLDQQDKEICEALERGVSVEEIKAQFSVDDDKIAQLQSVVTEAKETAGEQPAPEAPADAPEAPAAEGAQPEAPAAPEGEANTPEGEQTAQ